MTLATVRVDLHSSWWVIVVGLLVPLLVEALTKVHASAAVKALLAIFSTAVIGVVQSVVDHNGVISKEMAVGWFLAWASSSLAYLHLWKPIGVKGAIAPGVGLGGSVPPAHAEP